MGFSSSFIKSAANTLVEEDRADVTSRSLDSAEGVHSKGAKNMLMRGRSKRTIRSSGQSQSGLKTDTFYSDKEFIPERMTHFKRWENSRYPSGGGGSDV